jgi:anionic cell wall polymer biosynthesis LytR-Cps2A-Psr (LCP) family protein
MDGTLALAFARDRHSFPRSDIQRTWNQGYLVTAAVRTLAAKYQTIAGRFELASLLVQHAQLSKLGITDLVRLGQLADSVPADAIKNVTIPYTGGTQCLGVAQPAAQRLFADVRDNGILDSYPAGTPTTPDPRP